MRLQEFLDEFVKLSSSHIGYWGNTACSNTVHGYRQYQKDLHRLGAVVSTLGTVTYYGRYW